MLAYVARSDEYVLMAATYCAVAVLLCALSRPRGSNGKRNHAGMTSTARASKCIATTRPGSSVGAGTALPAPTVHPRQTTRPVITASRDGRTSDRTTGA